MEDVPYVYVVIVVLAAALVSIAIWSRRHLFWRAGALVVGVALIFTAIFSLLDLLSRPKPAEIEYAYPDIAELDVLYADWTENEAIYLLLRVPGKAEPRYYKLPWSISRAKELQQAMAEAGDDEAVLKISNPFFYSDVEDRERLFYATPQPSPPRKGTQAFDPAEYVPPEERGVYGVDKAKERD